MIDDMFILRFWPLIIIYGAGLVAAIVLLAFLLARIERRQLVRRMHRMRSEHAVHDIWTSR